MAGGLKDQRQFLPVDPPHEIRGPGLEDRAVTPQELAGRRRKVVSDDADRIAGLLAVLLGCGLRRSEVVHLTVSHLQRREDHWAIVDLVGKGGHVRTVPVPDWVKARVDDWMKASGTESAVSSAPSISAGSFGEMG